MWLGSQKRLSESYDLILASLHADTIRVLSDLPFTILVFL